MGKSLIDMMLDDIVDDFFTSERIGRIGERRTERKLKLFKFLTGENGKTLRNVYIPKENGETSEIDVLFITEKGIFVIESKNYSGWIFGNENDGFWTAMLPNRQKNKFYNPVKQNRTHIKWLKTYLEDEIPSFSLIVFSERCELKKITMKEDSTVKVIKRDRLYHEIQNVWSDYPDVWNTDKIESVYESLKKLTNVDEAIKQAHIDSIQERYKSDKVNLPDEKQMSHTVQSEQCESELTKNSSAATDESKMICPKCGGNLVLRTARKGKHAGEQFYGCSNFPKCRFVKNVD